MQFNMRTVLLIILLIIFTGIVFASIGKIIGEIGDAFDYKKDHTHDNDED